MRNLGLLDLGQDLGLRGRVEFIAAVVIQHIGLELGRAGIDGLVHRMYAEAGAQGPHPDLAGQFRSQRSDLPIGQTVVLAAAEQVFIEHRRVQQFGAQRHESGDLLDEPEGRRLRPPTPARRWRLFAMPVPGRRAGPSVGVLRPSSSS